MQIERHKRFYGLDVTTDVDAKSGGMSGRVASQLFHIVVEALSNIVKHTGSGRLRRSDVGHGSVCARVGNEQSIESPGSPRFVPKSIKSRVEALGGSLEVQYRAGGYTVVQAVIPT